MLAREIRRYIQEPVLAACGWVDESSKVMVYGTGWVETNYAAVMQYGTPKNGGIGFYQGQPSDHTDNCIWLKNGFAREMLERLLKICNYAELPSDPMHMAYNIAYATLMCRIHYHRATKKKLPAIEDGAEAFAEYHFKYYNGNGEGKADVQKNTAIFQRILNAEI